MRALRVTLKGICYTIILLIVGCSGRSSRMAEANGGGIMPVGSKELGAENIVGSRAANLAIDYNLENIELLYKTFAATDLGDSVKVEKIIYANLIAALQIA